VAEINEVAALAAVSASEQGIYAEAGGVIDLTSGAPSGGLCHGHRV